MAKISIVYWSGTGNTENMAQLIKEGAEGAGAEVAVCEVSDINPDDALGADIVVLGCPSMGDEVLEESEFEPFIEELEGKVSGKKIGLFGSYGWGDGQWMRDWEERMKSAGAVLISDYVIVQDAPEGDDAEACKALGKAAATA